MEELEKNNKREIFGWVMYDWANSAYYTTVIGVLIAPYLTALAQSAVGENGTVVDLGVFGAITAKSMTSAATVLGVSLQALIMLTLGAIADYSRLKKVFMAVLCYIGVMSGALLFFIEGGNYLLGCLLLIISNVCIGSSLVFYNAFLVDITTEDRRNAVSAQGFGVGYAGGFIMLMLNFALLGLAPTLGISQGFAVRLCLLAAALWWGGFAIFTFALVKNRGEAKEIPAGKSVFGVAFSEIGVTVKQLFKLPHTLIFLLAYLFYNDGVQTVIYQASVFIDQELFVANKLETARIFEFLGGGFEVNRPTFLILLFAETQLVAMIGSFFWEIVARKLGNKFTILLSLAWWFGIVIFAYGFLREPWQAWILGAAIGFVLGGTQALSRSLYSQIIPRDRAASFFSFYEISERGTSWMGPLVFGIVVASTNSYRQAILALVAFFLVGSLILLFMNLSRAVAEANPQN